MEKQRGFTLVELMIVIAIIGLLSVVLVPKIGQSKDAAKNAGVQANMRQIQSELNLMMQDYSNLHELIPAFQRKLEGNITNPYSGSTSFFVHSIRDGLLNIGGGDIWTKINGLCPVVNIWSLNTTRETSDYWWAFDGNGTSTQSYQHRGRGGTIEGSVMVAFVQKDPAVPYLQGSNIMAVIYGIGKNSVPFTLREKALVVN